MAEPTQTPERIEAADVARRMRSGEPLLLVCAYEADVAWRKFALAGAWPLSALDDRMGELEPGGLVVFYCRCPKDKTASDAARALAERGFEGARVLAGGYDAALAAGLRALRRG